MEILQLYVADEFGKDVNPLNYVHYIAPQPVYFLWVDEEIYTRSSGAWTPFQAYVPCSRSKDDLIIGAVLPAKTGGFVTFTGEDFVALKKKANQFRQYRHKLSHLPIVEYVVEEKITTIPTREPYIPKWFTGGMWLVIALSIIFTGLVS